MGCLGGLFSSKSSGKKSSSAPLLEALRDKVEENPADAKLAHDLANQLRAAGDLEGALEYARRSAQAHQKAGFATKALAVLKGAGYADAVHVGGGVVAWGNQIDPSQPSY